MTDANLLQLAGPGNLTMKVRESWSRSNVGENWDRPAHVAGRLTRVYLRFYESDRIGSLIT